MHGQNFKPKSLAFCVYLTTDPYALTKLCSDTAAAGRPAAGQRWVRGGRRRSRWQATGMLLAETFAS